MTTQAIPTLSAIPLPRASAAAQFFIVVSHPSGDYCPERNTIDLGRDATVSDIAAGLYGQGVSRVLGLDLISGRSWDATREIAESVLNQALDIYEWESMPIEVMDFLEEVLGCAHVRAVGLEAAA